MSDLARLFEMDPLKMSDQDIEAIVNRMREAKAQFELGVKSPVAERKRKAAKSDLLDELGLTETKADKTKSLLKELGLD